MKPIKVWLAQDRSSRKNVFCYGKKKPVKYDFYWRALNTYELGKNLLKQGDKPIKGVIITEQYFNELLEEARLK